MALTKIKTGGIADNAITNAKMADDAIDSADFADGSIDNVHLAGSIAVSKTLLAGGTGLTLSTNTLNVDAAQTQITSVGTLTGLTVSNASAPQLIAQYDGSTRLQVSVAGSGVTTLATDNSASISITNGLSVAGNVAFTANVSLNDNDLLQIGSGDDLRLYHDGSNSYIKSTTGWLNMPIGGSGISIANSDFSEAIAKFLPDGACELYHNGTKRIETTSTGATISGHLSLGAGFDMTSPHGSYTQLNAGGWGVMHRGSWDVYETSNCYYNTSGTWTAKYSYSGGGIGMLGKWGGVLVWDTYDGAVTAGTGYTLSTKARIEKNGDASFTGAVTSKTNAKFWIRADPYDSNTIEDSYNYSSMTDHGTGDFQFAFVTAMPSAAYCLVGGAHYGGGTNDVSILQWQGGGFLLTGSCRVHTASILNDGDGAFALFDAEELMVVIFDN